MSDELKERPMDFETERPSQSEIDAAVAEITARLKAADAKEDRIALLEAEVKELKEAGATIISAIRFGLSQDELEAMEEFELLLQEDKPHE